MYIYAIMKTMCPPSYHHNDFVATHALEHMMYVKGGYKEPYKGVYFLRNYWKSRETNVIFYFAVTFFEVLVLISVRLRTLNIVSQIFFS